MSDCKTIKLRESYNTIIKIYLNENIVEEVKDDEIFESVHYLRHRAVIRNERDTTKIRVVFDTSAKSSKQPSIKYILYSEPCLLALAQHILLCFRIGETAIVAYIQQAICK